MIAIRILRLARLIMSTTRSESKGTAEYQQEDPARHGAGSMVAADVKCSVLPAQLELLCGGDKRCAIFGDKSQPRAASSVRIAPGGDQVHSRIA